MEANYVISRDQARPIRRCLTNSNVKIRSNNESRTLMTIAGINNLLIRHWDSIERAVKYLINDEDMLGNVFNVDDNDAYDDDQIDGNYGEGQDEGNVGEENSDVAAAECEDDKDDENEEDDEDGRFFSSYGVAGENYNVGADDDDDEGEEAADKEGDDVEEDDRKKILITMMERAVMEAIQNVIWSINVKYKQQSKRFLTPKKRHHRTNKQHIPTKTPTGNQQRHRLRHQHHHVIQDYFRYFSYASEVDERFVADHDDDVGSRIASIQNDIADYVNDDYGESTQNISENYDYDDHDGKKIGLN
ncbi:hypothetical protein HELRODRAFT_159366 [Helobdella robusta]|uniref:Uncharacterized protein n=1 Tax=Helobdella robusta TaxID=6412 RepID=T1ENY1_HELRO|nr:hypothetical protein HELRODRAFT_159366 [Helobdella robusta]ESO12781.1 hypothetical protein HELRODRAFT_159366 [Helobdella robusta]